MPERHADAKKAKVCKVRPLVFVAAILTLSSSVSGQNATGIAFWPCNQIPELYIRIADYQYTASLYVFTDPVSTALAGRDMSSDIKICRDGAACITAKGKVHFDRVEKHKITGRFTVSLPNGETVEDSFEVKHRPRSKKDICE